MARRSNIQDGQYAPFAMNVSNMIDSDYLPTSGYVIIVAFLATWLLSTSY